MSEQSKVAVGTPIKLREAKRTYQYPRGEVVLENVFELIVRESGSHRLKTEKDGEVELHILPAGWLQIKIKADDWTI